MFFKSYKRQIVELIMLFVFGGLVWIVSKYSLLEEILTQLNNHYMSDQVPQSAIMGSANTCLLYTSRNTAIKGFMMKIC